MFYSDELCRTATNNHRSPTNAAFDQALKAELEKRRARQARELGLPETASWHEISGTLDTNNRREAAIRLGLPETATWAQIAGKSGPASPRFILNFSSYAEGYTPRPKKK